MSAANQLAGSHICVSRCRKNAHIAFEGRNIAQALVAALESGDARTEQQREFWRESEQAWVPHVNIRTWGASKDEPKKWRTRDIVTVVHVGEWREGKK